MFSGPRTREWLTRPPSQRTGVQLLPRYAAPLNQSSLYLASARERWREILRKNAAQRCVGSAEQKKGKVVKDHGKRRNEENVKRKSNERKKTSNRRRRKYADVKGQEEKRRYLAKPDGMEKMKKTSKRKADERKKTSKWRSRK